MNTIEKRKKQLAGLGIAGGIMTVSIVFGSVMERIKKGKLKANDK